MPVSTTPADCDNPGKEMTLYYNTGTCGAAVWVEHLGIQGDLQLDDTDEENETQRRRSTSLVKEYSPGLTEVSISGNQVPDSNYQGNLYINSARKGGSPKDFLILTNTIATVHAIGWRGKFYNFTRSISGPFSGQQEQSFNLKPAACSDCPVRPVKVAVADALTDYDVGAVT